MDTVLNFLKGKKTYLVSAMIALAVFAHLQGWIDKATLENITFVLTGAGLAALRAGVEK